MLLIKFHRKLKVADFYQLLLFDKVLTDEEREWVKENLIEPDTVSAAKSS